MTLTEERSELAYAESSTYSPSAFPGSAEWQRNVDADAALKAFDAAHPEVIVKIKADRAAEREAKWGNSVMRGM